MKSISRVILSAILLVVTGLAAAAASAAPEAVFAFWPGLSEKLIGALAAITSPLPFAVWEVLALLVILWAVYTLVRCFGRHRGFVTWLSGVLLAASAAVCFFTLSWGLGHFGPTAGERMGLEVREYTTDELYAAAAHYANEASEYAAQVRRDANGEAALSQFSVLAKEAGAGYLVLSQKYDCFRADRARVKRLTAAKLYSYFGTTGVFVPFTGESSVNPDTFEVSLPFTMCHELAHRQGYPAEDDANFCAYLACMANPSAEFRYSGSYSAFLHCYNALYEVSPERAAEVWAMASEEVRRDCRAASLHYEPYEGAVQEAAQKVNDAYLKAFDEEAGVESYGAVADYLIAWYLEGQKTA